MGGAYEVEAGAGVATGGEYKAAKRFFSSSAVSCFGVAPTAGTAGVGAGAGSAAFKDPVAGPGPSGPADTRIPVSAMVGVAEGSTADGMAAAITGAAAAEAAGAGEGMGAGDWFKTWVLSTEPPVSPALGEGGEPLAAGASELMLDSSLAWLSPKL